jgi:hypothetical protein
MCNICTQEMLDSVSCINDPVITRVGLFVPIPFGNETRLRMNMSRCGDCGTPRTGFHHRGCDCEECPRCHGQLISCGCQSGADYHDVEELDIYET